MIKKTRNIRVSESFRSFLPFDIVIVVPFFPYLVDDGPTFERANLCTNIWLDRAEVYMSRLVPEEGTWLVQEMKDMNSSKYDCTIKIVKDLSSDASSRHSKRFSSGLDSTSFKNAKSEKLKQAEESLRIVMYLSCWGPN